MAKAYEMLIGVLMNNGKYWCEEPLLLVTFTEITLKSSTWIQKYNTRTRVS